MLGMGDWRAIRLCLLAFAVACLALSYGCGGAFNSDPLDPDDPRPRMFLKAFPSSGKAPLTVNLDGSGCWAKDKGSLTYDWDFNGDGTYDKLKGLMTEKRTFTTVGKHVICLCATDAKGNKNTITAVVEVTKGGGDDDDDDDDDGDSDAVSADLKAFLSQGTAPHTVWLDASGSWSAKTPLSYEYDCDGDGDYEATSSSNTHQYTYTTEGTYHPKVRVTNSVNKTATATTTVTVTKGGGPGPNPSDKDPVVAFNAYPTSGVAPFEVFLDASASWARSGTMARFEFDADGDGDYDVDTTASTIKHTYTTAGSYKPRVRGTDSGGRSATATGPAITVTAPAPNQAPTAILVAQPVIGVAPLTVNFDGSASWDADGTIARHDWDFNGDGTFEVQNGGAKPGTREFATGGNHTVRLRVTDNDGATGQASIIIYVTGGTANQAPVAKLSAVPLSGQAPLVVNFDATASTDPNGDALTYHFDFEGDGDIEDVQTDGTASFTYHTTGIYDALVRVRDPGGLENTATVRITVGGSGGNHAPVARLTANPTSGNAPLTVTFNPWESSDPDNDFVRFLFDYNGDGTIDVDYDNSPPFPFRPPDFIYTYTAAGTYSAKLTVRDTEGAEDSAIVVITVDGGGQQDSWPIAIVTANPAYGGPGFTATFYGGLSSSVGSAIHTFDWDMDDNGTFELLDVGPEQTRSFPAEGTFYVNMRVTDYKGRQATGQCMVIVSSYF